MRRLAPRRPAWRPFTRSGLRIWRDDRRSATGTGSSTASPTLVARPPARTILTATRARGAGCSTARWTGSRSRRRGAQPRARARGRRAAASGGTPRCSGRPNREDDVVPLAHLDDLLRAMRLLRRSAVASSRPRAPAPAPRSRRRSLDACASALLAGETFDAAVGELASALHHRRRAGRHRPPRGLDPRRPPRRRAGNPAVVPPSVLRRRSARSRASSGTSRRSISSSGTRRGG